MTETCQLCGVAWSEGHLCRVVTDTMDVDTVTLLATFLQEVSDELREVRVVLPVSEAVSRTEQVRIAVSTVAIEWMPRQQPQVANFTRYLQWKLQQQLGKASTSH